jgi:hypothetical protein
MNLSQKGGVREYFLPDLSKSQSCCRSWKRLGGLHLHVMSNRGVISCSQMKIQKKLKKAQSILKDINEYAKRAPILICAIASKTYSDNKNYNRLHFHDLGAANENMFLEAFNQGLIMHEMGGLDVQKAKEVFNIPEEYEMGIMIAIGYQGTHDVLPESLVKKASMPRERKSLSEIAFLEELNNSFN